ncbi:ABC transporter permease [Chitinophaga sp. NPDC101104]|uniref:ABC transporter permease n=1 Tax=Chitinophaga sp. NPDC101104 TaxID=3390561 RepID=UPI003D036CA0
MHMLSNHLKIAWRNLWNNKVFGVINITGLTIGMTACMFILLWVANEYSFNRYHEKLPNIYQVYEHQYYSHGDMLTTTATPGPLLNKLKTEVPGVRTAASVSWNVEKLISVGERNLKFAGHNVDNEFFSIFSFPFQEGNPARALTQPGSVVLTDKTAETLFGGEKALGKIVRIDNAKDYTVTGVVKAPPENSSLKFAFLLPMQELKAENPWLESWGNNAPRTYVLLDDKADINKVNASAKDIIKRNAEGSSTEVFLYPYSDIYLKGSFKDGKLLPGRMEYVRLFIIVAVFVLLIACINFMNLSTARAVQRSKEVGVRKSIGAGRFSLVSQFLGESFALVMIASVLSVLLVWLLMPAFESMVNTTIGVPLFTWYNMLAIFVLGLFTGFAAGSYPAFYLSSLNPVSTLKGGMLRLKSSAVWLRKGLVVFQFAISTVLIVAAALVFLQIQFIKNRNLGLNKDQVVYFTREGGLSENLETFRRALEGKPGIMGSTVANQLPIDVGNSGHGVSWPGKSATESVLFDKITVGDSFGETMQLEMLEGRTFSADHPTDKDAVVINETAARLMKLQKPWVGRVITVGDRQTPIIGVVRDFASSHLSKKSAPMILESFNEPGGKVMVRIKPGQADEALASIESVYKEFNPEYPLELKFMDVFFEKMYKSEAVIGRLSTVFTILAIMIACLGLFGLAAFTAQQRTKEIGIRKVLGATVGQILVLLSKDFLRLVLVAVAIALPLAAYFMQGWLEQFSMHIELSWWIFAGTALLSLALAMMTVSYQSVRTARMNPVKSLRAE